MVNWESYHFRRIEAAKLKLVIKVSRPSPGQQLASVCGLCVPLFKKLPLTGPKSRSKAMMIAVGVNGVESVSLKGKEKNELEVIGDEIDAVKLTKLLRKNIGFAQIMNVSAVDMTKRRNRE